MKTIELYLTNQGWMANHIGDEEIRSLFGTTIIPTAFTSKAQADTVQAKIAALNPDKNVVVIGR